MPEPEFQARAFLLNNDGPGFWGQLARDRPDPSPKTMSLTQLFIVWRGTRKSELILYSNDKHNL